MAPGGGASTAIPALLAKSCFREDGDRDLHGNVTVRSGYLNRVLDRALAEGAGVAVVPQSSRTRLAGVERYGPPHGGVVVAPFVRETGLPLLGMTMGSDGCWSARFWDESARGRDPSIAEMSGASGRGPRWPIAHRMLTLPTSAERAWSGRWIAGGLKFKHSWLGRTSAL